MEDSEVSLPKATIVKLIKDYMPSEMRVASDTTDMLLACCTEFVQLVSSEANTVAEAEGKKTIQPEHVLTALGQLGFPDYCPEVSAALEAFKEDAKATNTQKAALRKTGADQAGLTQEQQIALQQQMFAAARAASLTTTDSAAAMAAAYHAQLAAQGGHAPGGGAATLIPLLPVASGSVAGGIAGGTLPHGDAPHT